ncbi:hypothetical protein VZQ01_22270 [Myxococcus faecalis]|uniref:hypothetical protein n=1 Tax=Myxococcus faecalis TaxID=3115646 RepID=UPI003CF59FEF
MAIFASDEPRLSANQRAVMEKVLARFQLYGPYLLEATNREDLQARVDTLLEDPRFHDDLRLFAKLMAAAEIEDYAALLAQGPKKSAPDWIQALGPAAASALYRTRTYTMEMARCVSVLKHRQRATLATNLPSASEPSKDPLAFLSDAGTPVPVARALLAGTRVNALQTALGAAILHRKSVEPWLGLAIAESLAENSRCFLALLAALTGTELPASILPPEEQLDIRQMVQQGHSLRDAYEHFHADAERSGEPVYPATR